MAFFEKSRGPDYHFFHQALVVLCRVHQPGQLQFEGFVFASQYFDLALMQGDGLADDRANQAQTGKDVGMILEEFGVVDKILCNGLRIDSLRHDKSGQSMEKFKSIILPEAGRDDRNLSCEKSDRLEGNRGGTTGIAR